MAAVFFGCPDLVWARVPNDPGYSDQSAFFDQIHAPAAWDIATGSARVVVAIIDTGADIWHEDLSRNIWTNPFEIPDNGVDDDLNGYVDDLHGWNFVEKNNNPRTSVFESSDDPEAIRHGTIVAGILGAVGDNELAGTGVNWNVRIMPLRAVDSHGSGSYAAIGEAVVYAVKNGASVISMSFVGENPDSGLKEVLRWAYEQGVVIVAAAGNNDAIGLGDLDKHPVYPACDDVGEKTNWILAVSSVDAKDRLSWFADYGACVDIVAPGQKIYSSERYAPDYGFKKNFGGPWNGTSFATPLVAGTAALIKSMHPEWTARQIIDDILLTADDVSAMNIGYGDRVLRLNTGAAVRQAYYSWAPTINYSFGARGGDIWMATDTEKIFFAGVSEARVVAVASGDLSGGWKPEVAALIERKPYLYVRLFRNNGEVWREFALKNSRSAVGGQIVIARDQAGSAMITVSKYDKKSGQTIWESYDVAGALQKSARYRGSVRSWQMSSDGAGVDFQILINRKLTTKTAKWYN